MGKKSRNKGYRAEHNLVCLLREHGFEALRVPLSGGAKGFEGDVLIEKRFKAEVKARHDGFKELYKWLQKADILFVKADFKDYLAVLPLSLFLEILKGWKEGVR